MLRLHYIFIITRISSVANSIKCSRTRNIFTRLSLTSMPDIDACRRTSMAFNLHNAIFLNWSPRIAQAPREEQKNKSINHLIKHSRLIGAQQVENCLAPHISIYIFGETRSNAVGKAFFLFSLLSSFHCSFPRKRRKCISVPANI